MNIRISFLFLTTILTTVVVGKDNTNTATSAITYKLNLGRHGGRLGDCLINYIKAKWISYSNNIPLYCPKFKYSEKLMLSKIEKRYNKKMDKQYKKRVVMPNGKTIIRDSQYCFKKHKEAIFNNKIEKDKNFLYVSNYYANITINWDDKNFIKELKKTIAPVKPIKKPEIPKNMISVALHVRKGGGYDPPLLSKKTLPLLSKKILYADQKWPLKFPPDNYYIAQIKKLHEILDKQPLYIYIFTDDQNPQKIAEEYKNALKIENITFAWREKNNAHNKNVIQDLFEMTYYDCLIRALSNFGAIADIVGNFHIVIHPEGSYHWEGDKLIIDKVKIRINNNISENL